MTPAHDFIVVGEGIYRVEVPDLGLMLQVDRLRRKNGELLGELTVTCNLAGAQRVTDEDIISAADFNLSSMRARQDRASWLAKRSQLTTHDWGGTVEYLCLRVIGAERSGQPAVLLRDVPKPSPDSTWLVHGLPILREQPLIMFGDGGCGKSLLALSMAGELVRRGVPTLYADWETSAADHRERLEQLFGPDMPAVHYLRAEWPLTQEVDRLRRAVLSHDIQYLVLDSIAFGCDGPPEAAEVASGYLRALRQLRVGALLVAHVRQENGEQRPFGSAFWHNGARATWFAKRSEADGDQGSMTLGLFNRKANTGPLLSARGLRLRFGDERICISPTDLAEHDDFAAKLPLWQRMKAALGQGPLTLPELAEAVDAKLDSVIKAVNRSDGKTFTKLPGADGRPRVYLVDRRSA